MYDAPLRYLFLSFNAFLIDITQVINLVKLLQQRRVEPLPVGILTTLQRPLYLIKCFQLEDIENATKVS